MKLTKQTAIDIREALAGKDVQTIAEAYRSEGLSFKRFIWDAFHSIGYAKTSEIIMANNPLTEVGGYIVDINDSHIETMLKVAFKDCKF